MPAARYIGVVFAVFCLGLLPYMIFQLQLRVFYSLHDSKTPALIGLVTMIVNIVANLIALSVLPPRHELVAGLGVGFGVANLVGMVIAWRILSPAAARAGRLPDRPLAGPDARRHACRRRCSPSWSGWCPGARSSIVIIGGGLAVRPCTCCSPGRCGSRS